ncbi:MAG: ABC transporter permease [Anaerolineae bacterium]|nr:ABC transporter permease [Anaerolineae bacterium]
MTFWQTLKVAWEGLTLNKVRSFLTTLGVIIGVAAVIVMMAVSAGAEAEIADQINALGANLIMVMPSFQRGGPGAGMRQMPSLTYDDLQVLADNLTGISGVSAEQNTVQDVKGSGTLEDISVIGTTPGFMAVRDYHLAEGRFITLEDNELVQKVAVLGHDIALELFGDADPIGQPVKVGSTRLTVVGVMAEKGVVGNTDYDSRIYIPITVVFKRYTNARFGSDRVNVVYVSAESKDTLPDVMDQLDELVMQILGTTPESPGFTLTTQDSIIDARASTTETFRNLLAWVAAVSLVVGGIGIMNIMLVSVTERTREIGLRQALGARPRDVQRQFLLEAVMLSLLGGLLGVLGGVGGAWLFDEVGSLRTEIVWASIPLAFGAAAAVGIFFGYYPATKAAQLDPIVALRHE